MSYNAHIETWLGKNSVEHWARTYGLPAPKWDTVDEVYYLNAQDVREWAETKLIFWAQDGATICQFLITEHAHNYISEVISELDMKVRHGEITRHQRKDYLRQKTKEYRMVFA
jgi:hypothetical protein